MTVRYLRLCLVQRLPCKTTSLVTWPVNPFGLVRMNRLVSRQVTHVTSRVIRLVTRVTSLVISQGRSLKVLCSYSVNALSKFALLRYLSEIRFQVLDSDVSAIYP